MGVQKVYQTQHAVNVGQISSFRQSNDVWKWIVHYIGHWTYSQRCSTTVLLVSQEILCLKRNVSAGTRTETLKPYTKYPPFGVPKGQRIFSEILKNSNEFTLHLISLANSWWNIWGWGGMHTSNYVSQS